MSAQSCIIAAAAVLVAFCIAEGQATTCYSCSGQACLRTSQVNITKQCTVANDPCAVVFKGYVPEKKGCYSDFSTDEKAMCDATDNLEGYKCSGDHCNSLGRVDHKCKSCIATSSNSSCLFASDVVADTRCTAPRTQDVYCSVSIVGNATHRRCVTSNRDIFDCISHPTMCSLCAVNAAGSCNTFEFPANRRQCQYCSGDNCELTNVTTTAAVLRTCPAPQDQCVTMNQHKVFKRLCAQEMTDDMKQYCVANNASCVFCSTNGCNVATPPNESGGAATATLSMAVLAVLVVALMGTAGSDDL